MARLQSWASIIVCFFFITSQPVLCEDSEMFHIIPSSSSPCPGELTGEPCFTLPQYISGQHRQYSSDPSEIVLEFQPGHHTLRDRYRTLNFASQLFSFTMNSKNSTGIYCNDRSQYLITNVRNVRISGIDFVRCGLRIESVTNFILEESSFSQAQYYYLSDYKYDVLHIKSSSATIKGCNFSNNYRLPLHIDNSSIELHHTIFVNNKGDHYAYTNLRSGGVLSIENTQSIVTISHCSFINNSAYYNGGAASIRSATISILNSTFSQNRAENGGVFAVDDS